MSNDPDVSTGECLPLLKRPVGRPLEWKSFIEAGGQARLVSYTKLLSPAQESSKSSYYTKV